MSSSLILTTSLSWMLVAARGGFTDYALRHGAKKVIAVDKGTRQMASVLALDPRVELHEKTDIRQFQLAEVVDLVLIDLSFVSLKEILPTLGDQLSPDSVIAAMVKPQFETDDSNILHKGIIKNEHMRRAVLLEFERWLKPRFFIQAKADSKLSVIQRHNRTVFVTVLRGYLGSQHSACLQSRCKIHIT